MISVSVPSEFLSNVTMHRFSAGDYVDGVWVEGVETDSVIAASVQPLTGGDYRLLPEGNSSQRGWKLFWNGDFQFGADGSLRPDEITYEGIRFKLTHKEEWIRNGYSAALFIEVKQT